MAKTFRLVKDGLQDRFLKSRAKVRIFGGGFANGKTTSLVMLALQVARDYPGSNLLLGRSTYPKLRDTLFKEVEDWCPPDWIASFLRGDDKILTLTNGSTIRFRHIKQQGANTESTTSNLLSATYDFIGVDQMEDPEIEHKDFLDLMGRLRGNTPYAGDDPTMPRTGPRWLVMTCNPTAGWLYQELVKPLQEYARGEINPKLLVDVDTREPIIELFEGSTYENKQNLERDFIAGLESTYKGQMRDRFLLGRWAAYEGLVYPSFDEEIHMLNEGFVDRYFNEIINSGFKPEIIRGYDDGISAPSCYLLGFSDPFGNYIIADGFHEKGLTIPNAAQKIKEIDAKWGVPINSILHADPALFKRHRSNSVVAGETVADMMQSHGVTMSRGNNNIINGIHKISYLLEPNDYHRHVLTGDVPGPKLYISHKVPFFRDEITAYRWKKNTHGQFIDQPVDKDDHAMDTAKYMLTRLPNVAELVSAKRYETPIYKRWHELEDVATGPNRTSIAA